MNIKELWFTFQGRATRSDYWLRTFLPIMGIYMVLAILLGLTSGQDGPSGAGIAIFYLVAIVLVIPSIAVSIKRFHDQNRTGWLVLLGFIPFIGGLILLVMVGFLPGTPGDNDYGPDPRGASSA